jgi:UDP-2,3-diacylglucosamine pyrophosphatase LpxH
VHIAARSLHAKNEQRLLPGFSRLSILAAYSCAVDRVFNEVSDSSGMSNDCFDTLLISDVHLGSELSRAREALELLRSSSYARLILLGDIFSDLNFRRLTGEHWKFLSLIRKISNPKRRVEVVWVEGNHDEGLSRIMSHLVGVPVYQRYVWEYAGKRHLAVHGHQFDRFVCRNLLINRLGHFLYQEIQKIDGDNKTFSRFLDRLNTRWLRLSAKVEGGAIAYARLGRIDRVFCGHTHQAGQVERDGIAYCNTGCWVSAQPTYATVDEQGVRIHEYTARIDDRDTGEERTAQSPGAAGFLEPAGLSAFAGYKSLRC